MLRVMPSMIDLDLAIAEMADGDSGIMSGWEGRAAGVGAEVFKCRALPLRRCAGVG
jgi:hypothetical protein